MRSSFRALAALGGCVRPFQPLKSRSPALLMIDVTETFVGPNVPLAEALRGVSSGIWRGGVGGFLSCLIGNERGFGGLRRVTEALPVGVFYAHQLKDPCGD